MNAVHQRVKEVIVRALDIDIPPDEIGTCVSLMEDGLGLDSVSILEIITGLEEEFEISITDEDISDDLLATVNTVIDYVEKRLQQ